MTHPSKVKGNGFERELVNQAKDRGLPAERAYASNGRALGCSEEVDLIVSGMRVQAKRRKAIAAFLRPPEGADCVAFRENHGKTYALLRWEDLLDLIDAAGGW